MNRDQPDMVESPSTLRSSRTGSKPTRPEAVAILTRQVLVFPLLVVLLACASFLFGGRCAAWQWWTAVAAVVLVPFARRTQWRSALWSAGLFALLLFALRCLIPPILWDVSECDDMSSCHLPMVQLLIEGWNPVEDPTENIVASLGLDIWGMAPLHIAFMPKTLAVFSSVAYTFIGDPRALTFPLPSLLWIGVLLSTLQMFRGFTRWALVSALIGVLPLVVWQLPVDLSLAYASCGLLLTMQDALRKRRCDWVALMVWSAWMVLIKPNGAFGFLVFFLIFAIAALWQKHSGWMQLATRFAACLAFLAVLAAIVLWNPLGTSWRTFGHPLYPLRTVDAERFPVKNLTWDFDVGNDDFKMMGKIGHLAHAYLSPRATIAYYRWKLERPDYKPEALVWSRLEYPSSFVRVGLIVLFMVLLLLKRGRPWAIAGLLTLVLLPARYTGYTRYTPWLSALGCLAIAFSAEWAESKLEPRLAGILSKAFVLMGFFLAISWGGGHSRDVECAAMERATTRESIRPLFSVPQESVRVGTPFGANASVRIDPLTYRDNQCRLFVKELGQENITKVVSAEQWMSPDVLAFLRQKKIASEVQGGAMQLLATAWGDRSIWKNHRPEVMQARTMLFREWTDGWIATPFGYYVPDDESADFLHEYRDDPKRTVDPLNPEEGVGATQKALHTWFGTYPREVLERIKGRKRK